MEGNKHMNPVEDGTVAVLLDRSMGISGDILDVVDRLDGGMPKPPTVVSDPCTIRSGLDFLLGRLAEIHSRLECLANAAGRCI